MEMEPKCGIVEDLLPLYLEGMTRPDTRQFITEHLATCESCRTRLEELRAAPAPTAAAAERAPLAALHRRLWAARVRAALLAALLAAAVLCCAFSYLTAPQYLTPEAAGLTVEERDGAPLILAAAGLHHSRQTIPQADGTQAVELFCWTTPLDRWRGAPESGYQLLYGWPDAAAAPVYYCANDGSPDTLLWGHGVPETDGFITLPRLALGYYLLAAALAAAVLGAAWALLQRKKKPAARTAGALCLGAVCYLAAHLLIKGTHTVSYNLPRDFSLILLVALLLWAAGLLGIGLWRACRKDE